MHDARLVRGLEPLRDLPRDVDRLAQRQRAAGQTRLQVLAGHQLEREEADPSLLIDPVDPRDVGVVQGGQRLGLALEASQPLLVLGEVLRQHLDRHLALQARVPGAEHLPHAAGPERTEDLVEGEGLTGGEGHGRLRRDQRRPPEECAGFLGANRLSGRARARLPGQRGLDPRTGPTGVRKRSPRRSDGAHRRVGRPPKLVSSPRPPDRARRRTVDSAARGTTSRAPARRPPADRRTRA